LEFPILERVLKPDVGQQKLRSEQCYQRVTILLPNFGNASKYREILIHSIF